jgi:hypothetical protein
MVKLNVLNPSCNLYCRFGIQLTIITLVWISKAMISIGTCDRFIFDIYVTEYGTALTTILPSLFLYLNTVTVTAGTFEP